MLYGWLLWLFILITLHGRLLEVIPRCTTGSWPSRNHSLSFLTTIITFMTASGHPRPWSWVLILLVDNLKVLNGCFVIILLKILLIKSWWKLRLTVSTWLVSHRQGLWILGHRNFRRRCAHPRACLWWKLQISSEALLDFVLKCRVLFYDFLSNLWVWLDCWCKVLHPFLSVVKYLPIINFFVEAKICQHQGRGSCHSWATMNINVWVRLSL